MLRTGLTAGVSAARVWAEAMLARAARARPAEAAASRRRGVRMVSNVAPVFRQNRGKNAVFSKSLGAVIGVAGQQLLGAIDLFGEHGAGQQVRPGHGAEGHDQRGFPQQRLAMAVGAADQEG